MNDTFKELARRFYGCLIIGLALLLLPANSIAGNDIFKDFSFDDCDPFEARARIMAVHGQKAQLVAAEQTIYVVDMSLGEQRLITEITDAQGNPTDFGSLNSGQWVLIKGFQHIKGWVVASLIQRIDQPVREKPILRKINKKSTRHGKIRKRPTGFKK